jgi:hypothetical protein
VHGIHAVVVVDGHLVVVVPPGAVVGGVVVVLVVVVDRISGAQSRLAVPSVSDRLPN